MRYVTCIKGEGPGTRRSPQVMDSNYSCFSKSGCRKKLGHVPCKAHQPTGGSLLLTAKNNVLMVKDHYLPCEALIGANVPDVLGPSVLKG